MFEQNTFNNIYCSYNQSIDRFAYCDLSTIICASCPGDPSNIAYIHNSSFNKVNGPIIVSQYDWSYGTCIYELNILMDDVVITTSRVVDDKALIITPSGTAFTMNNVSLIYELVDNLNENCILNTSFLNDSVRVECAAPYRFIYTEGSGFIEMNNVYVTNDLTNERLDEFRNNWIVSKRMNDRNISFMFMYSDYPEASEAETEMIYNNGSQLLIHNFTLFGVGLHERIVHNVGVAFIENFNLLRPDYWYNNNNLNHVKPFMRQVFKHKGYYNVLDSTKYDSEFIDNHECYFSGNDMENGLLMINDSIISGAIVAIYAQSGNVEIHNTFISDAACAVYMEDATSFKLVSSHLKNIGRYHVAAWVSWWMFDGSWYQPTVWLDSVRHIVIYNNIFEYFPVNWYLFVANKGVDLSVYVEIMYNEFKNPVTRDTFNIYKFGSIGKEYFKKRDEWNESYNTVQLVNTIYGAYGVYREDFVVLRGYISSSFVGNTFHKDQLMTSLQSACLSIDGYVHNMLLNSVCIHSNTFYGIAIKLQKANIVSCIYPQLTINIKSNEATQCWHQYGSFNTAIDQYEDGDTFIATDIDVPLFQFIELSSMILYNATISTEFTSNISTYNPLSFDSIYPWLTVNTAISFLDVVINESNNAIEIQFYEECVNQCTQLYQGSMTDIHQFHINCINISSESAMVSLSESLSLESVNHTLPHGIFLNSSGNIYPGGALDINFVILDSYSNVIHVWDQNISISLMSKEFKFETIMNIKGPEVSQCDICYKGLYIPNLRMDESLNDTYIVNTNVTQNILFVNDVNLTVTQCPVGFGLNTELSYCYECNIGECSIKASIEPCMRCGDELKGVSCIGGDKVIISKNYWIAFNYFGNSHIVSAYCPSSYCNQIDDGLYLQLYESQQLCALNRDPSVPLCGSCKPGYSELYGSANCGRCNRPRYAFYVLFVIIAILFTLFIIFMNGVSTNKHNSFKMFHINDDAKQYAITSIQKPILYHYQSVTFVLLNGGIFIYFSALAEIFNFQFDFGEQNTSAASGYCVLNGMTAKYKIISRLIIPICGILTLFCIMIIYKLMRNVKCRLFGRQIHFAKSIISMLLLTIGSFCGVCLKLISCRNITNNYSVHFYFGIDPCYDTIWFIGFFVLTFFVALFCSLFIKLYMDHKTKDIKYLEKETYFLESLINSYHIQKYWYWEIILFSRRLMIAMLTIITESIIAKNILFVLLFIYLCAHVHCNPFKMQKINILETTCLSSLLLILYVLDHNTIEEDNTFSIILLNILLILPFIVWVIQFIQTLYNPSNYHHNDSSHNLIAIAPYIAPKLNE